MTSETATSRAASLFSPRRPALWACVAMLVIGIVCEGEEISLMVSQGTVSLAVAIGAVVQLGLMLLVALFVVPRRRVPWSLRIPAIVLGTLFPTGVAVLLHTGSVTAPFAEEALKLITVAAVLWLARPLWRGPLDGFVIGFFVGVGFELVVGRAARPAARQPVALRLGQRLDRRRGRDLRQLRGEHRGVRPRAHLAGAGRRPHGRIAGAFGSARRTVFVR